MDGKFVIREAEKKDIPVIHDLILGLAKHEKRPEDVTGSLADLEYWIFERKICTTLLAEYDGQPVGYAIYYPVFGSYSARGRVHLEDIFIKSDLRGKGLGTKFMARVCKDALEKGYTGMEWSALDFNVDSIEYYKHLGAEVESGRLYFDFSEKNMKDTAARL